MACMPQSKLSLSTTHIEKSKHQLETSYVFGFRNLFFPLNICWMNFDLHVAIFDGMLVLRIAIVSL